MRTPVLPVALGVAGGIVAATVAALPPPLLDPAVVALGLPGLSTTPLSVEARTIVALLAGALVAGLGFAIALAVRQVAGRVPRARRLDGDVPQVRRADAHPDAAPRRPIMAGEDLGPPLPAPVSVEAHDDAPAESALPADLDSPLAAFDPAAVPDAPRAPVRPVSPLAHFETAPEPAPVAEPAAEMAVEPAQAESAVPAPPADPAPPPPAAMPAQSVAQDSAAAPLPLSALIERLERGAARRAAAAHTSPASSAPPSLDETLVLLRRLAAD